MTNQKILQTYSQLVYSLAVSQTVCQADAETIYQAVFVRYAQTRPLLLGSARMTEWFTKTVRDIAKEMPRTESAAPNSRPSKALEERTLAAMNSPEIPSIGAIRLAKLQNTAGRCRDFLTTHRRSVIRRCLTAAAAIAILAPLCGTLASRLPAGGVALSAVYTAAHQKDAKKSAAGCTVEVMETRISNDFLYLATDEDCSNILYQDLPKKKASGVYYYDTYQTVYSGEIRDKGGRRLRFDFSDADLIDAKIVDDAFFAQDTYHWKKQFKIYIPQLTEFCNAADGDCTCVIRVTPTVCLQETDEALSVVTLPFYLPLSGNPSATKTYALDYSYTLDNVTFRFQTLYIGPDESNIAIELIPHGRLEDGELQNLLTTAIVYTIPEGEDDVSPEELTPENLNQKPSFSRPVFIKGDITRLTQDPDLCEVQCYDNIYVRDSRYYIFSTYEKSTSPDSYDYDSLIQTAENGQFRVFQLLYTANPYVFGSDEFEYCERSLQPEFFRDKYDNSYQHYDQMVFEAMPTQTVKPGKLHGDPAQDGEEGNDFLSYYDIGRSFEAGDFTFHITALCPYYNVMDLTETRVNDHGVCRTVRNYAADILTENPVSYFLGDIIFFAEKDGDIIGTYDNSFLDGDEDNPYGELSATFENAPRDIPDRLILGYVEYATYNRKKNQWTGYVYYNPDYYNSKGVSYEEAEQDKQTEKDLAEFRENNTFTIVK